MDVEQYTEGGLATLIVGALVGYFKKREDRISKNAELERAGQQAVLERLSTLERRIDEKDKHIGVLMYQLSEANVQIARLTCENTDLRDELASAHKEISVLKDQFRDLYDRAVAQGMPRSRVVKP